MFELLQRLLPQKQWSLLIGRTSGSPYSLAGLTEHRPPSGFSWADPFLVERDDRHWIFFEEVIHHPKKGRIAVMELFADGELGPITVILERNDHLSYPFVFEHDGAHWMIPESRAKRTVDLYRCADWPAKWVHEKTLMAGTEIVDSTLLEHGGRWWLFGGTPNEPGGNASGQLCLWSADTPLAANWEPHPSNPVVIDRQRARPAGRIFSHEGQLIRPAQDCSVRYGYGVRLMQIDELTPSDYRESELQFLGPDFAPGVRATHTFNQAGGWLVGDAARRVRG